MAHTQSSRSSRRAIRRALLVAAVAVTTLIPAAPAEAVRLCGKVSFNRSSNASAHTRYIACATALTIIKRADAYQRKNPKAKVFVDRTGWRCRLTQRRGKRVQVLTCRPRSKTSSAFIVVTDWPYDLADLFWQSHDEAPFSLGSAVNWWGDRICVLADLANHGNNVAGAKLFAARFNYDFYTQKLQEAQRASGTEPAALPSAAEQEACPSGDATSDTAAYVFRYRWWMAYNGARATNIAKLSDERDTREGRALHAEYHLGYDFTRDRVPDSARSNLETFEQFRIAMKAPVVDEIREP